MTFPMPAVFKGIHRWEEGREIVSTHLYECSFRYRKEVICCMTPVRFDGLLHYPICIDKGWRWGNELLFLLREGKIIVESLKISRVVEYEEKVLFRNFSTQLFKKKNSAATPQEKLLYKLLLNSPYGKLGQRECDKFKIMKLSALGLEMMGKDITVKSIEVLRGAVDGSDPNSIVLAEFHNDAGDDGILGNIGSMVRLASYITSLSRQRLFEMVYKIGDNNIAYMDTDSVFSKVAIDSDELVGDKLGQWKKECVMHDLHLFGPKMYSGLVGGEGHVMKIKGLRLTDTMDARNKMIIENALTVGQTVFRRFIGDVYVQNIHKRVHGMNSRRYWPEGSNQSYPLHSVEPGVNEFSDWSD
jgi:hypothetical protein